ncbi:MAG TPA: TonB-dependent receptor [Candidatus Polarisedimenticolia bacterium]|nr:TonB-dependent receptor [Candidatus Polarisedimenticolia bacterium]
MKRTITALLSLLCLCGGLARSQEITGQIRGIVTDSSKAVIANATVTITNKDRNLVLRTVETNSAGEYVAPFLPVGRYSVTVEFKGFKKFVKNDIELNVSDRLAVDAALETGALTETVSVESDPLEVNLQSVAMEGLISGTQVRELPLNNRNYEQLVTLQPGVTSNAADQVYVGTTNPQGAVNIVSFSISGNRQSQNNWTIDGADNVDHGSNITLLVYPSVDAIAEFKVERSNYSPEFGRSASGQINVVTRSGTSTFHGGLYEFFRNDAFNANSFINNRNGTARPVLRYNDFGGTIGGPFFIPGVYNTNKEKTFFFFSEEVRRVTTPVAQNSIVPTDQERQGFFQAPVCTAVNTSGACTATGTQISSANFNPISAAYLKDVFASMPRPPASDGVLFSTFPGVFNYREELVRADHVVNSKVSVMGRLVYDHIPTKEPFGLFGPQSKVPGVANNATDSPGHQWMGRVTWQITPSIFNEAGYAYSYGAIVSDPTGSLARSKSPDVANLIKLPYPAQLNRIPNLLFDDDFSSLAGFGEYRDYNRNHNAFDNMSWIRGRHAMKFGFGFHHYQKKENAAGDNAGNLEFDSTNLPAGGIAREQDFANFLLGFVSSDFSQSPTDITADTRQNLWEFYGQDEYRMASNLSITFGLRYSLFKTPYDGANKLTTFDPSVYSAAKAPTLTSTGRLVLGTGDPLNGIIVGGVNSPYGDAITRQDKKNFAPRLGVAWDPFKKGKTSVRAGYGIFFDSVAAGLIEDNVFNNPPFLGSAEFGGGVFLSNLSSLGATASTIPPSLWTTDPQWRTPYSQQWNLDVQQSMGRGWLFDVGYVGNKGTHLVGVIDINQVAPGAALAAGIVVPGQILGCDATNSNFGSCSTSTLARLLNRIRPFVGYGTIGQISPRFYSNYNSLQLSAEKRFTGNSAVNFFYTWSHALTDNQSDRSTGIQNSSCLVCDYGRATLDRRHVFTGNYIYELPWRRSQQGLVGHLLGGYEFSGILTINSGLPFTVFTARGDGDPAAVGVNTSGAPNNGSVATPRPNQISNPNNGPKTFTQFFNTAAFARVTVAGASGNERRGAVNGPGLWRYDMALLKNTRIRESMNLQFRAEAFNLFNHTNFQTVGTTLTTTSTFGRVTAVRDPRILQLALKLAF